MGVFWRGLPHFLLEQSSFRLGKDAVAVETGTYLGDSAELLGGFFDSVISIERDETLSRNAQERFRNRNGIQIVHGSSRTALRPCVPSGDRPALFWLDAHFSGGVTTGEDDPCPLLSEVDVITSLRGPENTIVLIDDARALIGQNGWPFVSDVVRAFGEGWTILATDDVLVCSSQESCSDVVRELQQNSRLIELERLGGQWHRVVQMIRLNRPLQFASRLRSFVRHYLLHAPRVLMELGKRASERQRRGP